MSENQNPSPGRRFGYIVSMIFNVIFLYAVNNLHNWHVPFVNERFSEVLWIVNLTGAVNIFILFTFLFFDRRWYKSLMQAIINVFSLISTYFFWRVFPLDLPENIAHIARIGLIVVMGLTSLSILVELGNAVKRYNKSTRTESI